MNFDAFAVAAIAVELRSIILGGRVQEVTQINSLPAITCSSRWNRKRRAFI